MHGSKEYDSEELESIVAQKIKELSEGLNNFKELVKGMAFKDILEEKK